jgi:tetratricopeptide (TPR) repeat protein
MFRSTAVGLVAACIFALHPIHSEAVDWIAAVTELELALFYLLTFWFFLGSARSGGACSVPLQIAMAASFAFTLLSKEQALTLPLIAAVYEHFFRDDRGVSTRIQKFRRYGVLWFLAIVYLALRVRYLGGLAPSLERPEFGTKDLLISGLALVGRYCWKLVWPVELCAYYLFPADVSALHSKALWGAAALAICALAFAVLWKSSRPAAFGMVWLLLTLAPVLNVRWMTSNAFAERYLYLASMGFCWMAAWVGVQTWNLLAARGNRWRVAIPLGAALIATLWVVRIVARNRDWHDNLTFFTATLKVSPDAYYMHNNLGTEYWQMGNIPAAKKEWITALKLSPRSEFVLHNLGLVAHAEKNYPQARAFFLYALTIRPNYMDAHLDLGKTYDAMGLLDKAKAEFIEAEKLSPLSARVHITLSEFYLDRRQLRESEAEARRSIEIQPTTQGEWDLGVAECLQDDHTGAERAFLDALALSPSSSQAHFMLGLFYMDSGHNADSIHEYRVGLQLDPGNLDAIANLKKLEFLAGQPE